MSMNFIQATCVFLTARVRTRAFAAIAGGCLLALPAFGQTRAALTQSVDEPGRNPFSINTASGLPYYASFIVPVAKRYVIQTYEANCSIANSDRMSALTVETTTGGKTARLHAPAIFGQVNGFFGGVQVNYYVASGQGPLYADPGTTVYLAATSSTGNYEFKGCSFSIGGYVINNP